MKLYILILASFLFFLIGTIASKIEWYWLLLALILNEFVIVWGWLLAK